METQNPLMVCPMAEAGVCDWDLCPHFEKHEQTDQCHVPCGDFEQETVVCVGAD